MKKLCLCLLTNHDLMRLKRLVVSVQELIQTKTLELHPVIVVNTLSDDYYESVVKENFPFKVVRTESNGKPGKGKNSCHDVFLETDCDYMSQIDGDDILYPTFLLALEKHLKHYKHIDVLGVVPCDVLEAHHNKLGYTFEVGAMHGSVWGISVCPRFGDRPSGPQKDEGFFDHPLPVTDNFIILQSREAAAAVRMDEEIGCAEDQLFNYQYLAEHQKGNLSYFITMSSDFQIYDRTTPNSAQKLYQQAEWTAEIKKEILKLMPENRTDLSELPVIYHDLHMTQYDKELWANNFYNRHSELF